jgi:hypothetical protein
VIPVKGEEPGAFVVTSKKTGQKYVMSERTLEEVIKTMGEESFNNALTAEWVVLNEAERKLAEEIRQKYFTEGGNYGQSGRT